jgi:hypothetical protein
MTYLALGPTRLLIRPALQKNESLRGYVSRVSSRNGSSPQLNSMLVSLKTTSNAIKEIAALTGSSASILKQHGSLVRAHHNNQSGLLFGRCILSADQVWVQRRMVCPPCLANNDLSICCWEILDYNVCHEHGCYLVNRCSDCNRIFNWNGASSGKCLCGIRLADIKSEIAPINRRLICKLIAAEMAKSTTRSNQREFFSDSLAPLNWLFIVSNFVLSILIPGFCQEHLGKIRAMGNHTCEELLLVILQDREYYDQLRQFIFSHTFRNQLTMSRASRVGIFDNAMRDTFLTLYKRMPLHNHLFKIKAAMLKKRELDLQRPSMYAASGNYHRPESYSFQLQSSSFL